MKKFTLALAICAFPTLLFAEEDFEKLAPTIKCDEFRERFTEALMGNRDGIWLSDLFTGPKREKFEVPGIQAAIGCNATGMFEGFGATLLETDEANVKRFARFAAAAVRATEPTFYHADSLKFFLDVAKEALADARENERKSGWLRGQAEKTLGSYVMEYSISNSLVRTGIELRYKQENSE
ncbi:hypothetical protein [Bradyrhizobium sp. URHA0013]|uniref:hypothetical protein n=1 Tax=Bradyrhizobium sp. URHA0013 TaxID=1380352 RepID=UPI000487DB13|nr:hypothetical protein [Bradyrhizobium sp. URHA0013]